MRKVVVFALTLVVAAIGLPAGLLAAPPARQLPGAIDVTARNAQLQNLPGVRVQVREAGGRIVASGTTNSAGSFSFPGLSTGSYTIELLDAAGNIVGASASVAVTAGATATVTVTASAAGAIAAAAGGGLSLFGLGTVGTVAVIGAAAATTIIAVQATRGTASPSQ